MIRRFFEVLWLVFKLFARIWLLTEIQEFCKINFGVTFPLFEKGSVKGEQKQPLYQKLLQASEQNNEVLWNFEKFLLNSKGEVVSRYNSKKKPEDLKEDILKVLGDES